MCQKLPARLALRVVVGFVLGEDDALDRRTAEPDTVAVLAESLEELEEIKKVRD